MTEKLDLSADEVLTTTRAVRKRLDLERPVPMEVVRECLDIATQAPTGSNQQGWHFVVVTDAAKRKQLGDWYREAFDGYEQMGIAAANLQYDDPARNATQERVHSSARYLADHMGEVPVLLIPCISGGRVDGAPNIMASSQLGSIIPAAWSFCLAARERGLGTAWTTLHLFREKEAAELLGIPYDDVVQAALIPVAYTKGTDFKPGPRIDLDPIVHVDSW